MDIFEQIDKMEDLISYIENQLPVFAEQVAANDLAALVTNRVVQRGEDFRGSKFSPYSRNTVAAWRFWGKSRNQSAEKRVRTLSRAKGALSYSDFRKLNNLEIGSKNFEFTGEMWRKFGIVHSSKSGNRFSIRLGGTTSVAQKKIDENSSREGISIIEANETERSIVRNSVSGWMERQAERILNG